MGGCASKPKDLGTRKLPSPAVRKPHAPPEVPVQSPPAPETVAQEKKGGDESKEEATSLVGVCEAAPAKVKEPETSDQVEVKPTEAKVEAKEEEENEVTQVEEEKKEVAAPKEKEAETIVPEEKKQEVVVVTKQEEAA